MTCSLSRWSTFTLEFIDTILVWSQIQKGWWLPPWSCLRSTSNSIKVSMDSLPFTYHVLWQKGKYPGLLQFDWSSMFIQQWADLVHNTFSCKNVSWDVSQCLLEFYCLLVDSEWTSFLKLWRVASDTAWSRDSVNFSVCHVAVEHGILPKCCLQVRIQQTSFFYFFVLPLLHSCDSFFCCSERSLVGVT